MAKIVKFKKYGGPEVLEFEDIEVASPASREVRISVKAIGLNRAESMWRTGVYVEPVNLPGRLGYEISGVVDAIGSEVTHVAVGDVVSTMPSFSMNDYGMYGELVLAPAHSVVKHTDDISFEDAVAIWNVFITPYAAFVEGNRVKAGNTVLIPAASSGVGIGAIQVANMIGAVPIALTRTGAKKAELLAIGASHVIATDEEDMVAEVMRLTDGKGADFAFDPVGGPNFPKLVAGTAVGGTILIYGALSNDVTPLPMLEVLAKRITIHGYNLFTTTTTPELQKAAVEFVLGGLAQGKLKTLIAQRFKFADIVEAHRVLEKNQHVGRLVVEV
ncbi:MAG: Quinone oxidoreductase (EC [uncultured Paraburkholderia sp.]|uniref:zinc-dependent alcohol dehydrogenase family protein n=1 Tax=uncultured Paraburkholderia sp. TaxID=1822466 RepID=UPI0025929FCC|nr:zinc-dependent alcohol dehydrogenase family protein [uncultured Paraburkholderia sp.]CAH2904178.1 MAG: Quinone oxidoreductase (EC [uncultured Paraburkholderia sp.]CAH2942704.1 MAG: Quinone oxidoreductase (EC [uncultured Paraburkholderia sp.]